MIENLVRWHVAQATAEYYTDPAPDIAAEIDAAIARTHSGAAR